MSKTIQILGSEAQYYLSHVCRTIDKGMLHLPSSDTVDRLWIDSEHGISVVHVPACSPHAVAEHAVAFFTVEALDNIAHTTLPSINDFAEHRPLTNEVKWASENMNV